VFSTCDIPHCADRTRSAALLLALDIAGSLSSAGSSWQGSEIRDCKFLQGFRLAPFSRPPVELRGLIKPQQFALVSCAGDCRGRVSHRSVESRHSRVYSILMEPPTLRAARTLSSATVIRVVFDVQSSRRRWGVMGF
jgi:hypothetical protein